MNKMILESLIEQNLNLNPDGYWYEILSAQILSSSKDLAMRACCMSGRPDLLHTLIADFDADKHQFSFDGDNKIGLLEDTLRAVVKRKDIDRSDIGKKAFMDVIKILTRRTTKEEKVELSYESFLIAHLLANPEYAKDNSTPHFDMVVDTYNGEISEKWDTPLNHLKQKYPEKIKEFETKLSLEIKSLRAHMNAAVEGDEAVKICFHSIGDVLPTAPKPEQS